MARKLLERSKEFLGVDQKLWLSLEANGFGVDADEVLPASADAVDFNSADITFNIPREDSPSRSGRSVIARLSGKKEVEVSVEAMIIPSAPDALGNPQLPPMHPLLITAFGNVDTTNPAEIVYKLSRFNDNSARILTELTHSSRLAVGVIMDKVSFALPGDGKAMMTYEGFGQDVFDAGESKVNQATTGAEQLATLVVQDLTYTALVTSGINGNLISITYIAGGTAGAELVVVTGNQIVVSIDDGVSTATQIETAINASAPAIALLTVAVTGAGATAQAAAIEAFLVGGLGVNDLKVDTGANFEIGAFIDIIQASDGNTATIAARKIVAVGGSLVPAPSSTNPNGNILTLDGAALPVVPVGEFVIGHAPENFDPRTSEFALLGLKGTITIAGITAGDCEFLNVEIGITNNFTKKDFIYGTSRMCGFIPDKRRQVDVKLDVLLSRDNYEFFMRRKCFVAEDITVTLEPQDICAPAVADGKGQIFEFTLPKVEFNIPALEQPSDAFVTLSLEGIALAPSSNNLDEELVLTIK